MSARQVQEMQYVQQNEGWDAADRTGCDGQEHSAINIEVADGTVSSVRRGGPGINQRGIKDRPTCYLPALVLDFLFSVIASCFFITIIQLLFPSTVSNYQHLTDVRSKLGPGPLELRFCCFAVISNIINRVLWISEEMSGRGPPVVWNKLTH